MAKMINKCGKVVVLIGFSAIEVHSDRALGFKETIESQYPDIEMVLDSNIIHENMGLMMGD